uniref:F-box domain-containing protein n=1 Tax=Salarias fasciatus TaxID=181472 RepID=A0A672FAN6_SALFA
MFSVFCVLLQLFEQRLVLVLHWFQMWNQQQRKQLLEQLLRTSSSREQRFCRDLLTRVLPETRLDFSRVLPRTLSLHILAFLTPQDLCRAAGVCWTWRVLAEQDCLWTGPCIRRGWFLPYSPGPKEFGSWKNHYVWCKSINLKKKL